MHDLLRLRYAGENRIMKYIALGFVALVLGASLMFFMPDYMDKTHRSIVQLDGVSIGATKSDVFHALGTPFRYLEKSDDWILTTIDARKVETSNGMSEYDIWSYRRVKPTFDAFGSDPEVYALRVEFDPQSGGVIAVTCALIWNHRYFSGKELAADVCSVAGVKLGARRSSVEAHWGKGIVREKAGDQTTVYYPSSHLIVQFQGDRVFAIRLLRSTSAAEVSFNRRGMPRGWSWARTVTLFG